MLKRILSVLVITCAAPFALAGGPATEVGAVPTEADIARANDIAAKGTITSEEVAEIATALNASRYTVIWEDSGLRHLEFGDGLLRLGDGLGTYYQQGEQLPRGVYWNISDQGVWLGAGDGKSEVEIPANGVLVVGSQTLDGAQQPALVSSGQCVTCGAGFYACCCRNNGGSSKTCHCIANGSPSDCNGGAACNGGGPGSTGCNFPDAQVVAIQLSELLEAGEIATDR